MYFAAYNADQKERIARIRNLGIKDFQNKYFCVVDCILISVILLFQNWSSFLEVIKKKETQILLVIKEWKIRSQRTSLLHIWQSTDFCIYSGFFVSCTRFTNCNKIFLKKALVVEWQWLWSRVSYYFFITA